MNKVLIDDENTNTEYEHFEELIWHLMHDSAALLGELEDSSSEINYYAVYDTLEKQVQPMMNSLSVVQLAMLLQMVIHRLNREIIET